jgi:hypothetical protein
MRLLAVLLAALAVPLAGLAAAPADDSTLEEKVKATYLYKFGAFVEWPPSAFDASGGAITVCVAGRDPFDGILDLATKGQTIGARPIVVRRLDMVARDSGCQILYAGGSDRQSVDQALEAVNGAGVLTVTDAELGDTTGIVHFVMQDNHVRFAIDDQAAARNGLKISSKLLSLAVSFRPR